VVDNKGVRVVVTGANGFVGRHVINALERRGVPYVAIYRTALHEAFSGSGDHCALDLLSEGAAERLSALSGTHLSHLAWCAEHKQFWSSPKNLDWASATLSLVRTFAAGGRHVTAIGTCAEYDWSHGLCIENDTPIEPSTIYGQVKAATASLTQTACNALGLSCCWARLFFPFGLGEHPDRFVPSVASALAGRRPEFPVGNENWRDFLAVEDVADAIVHLTLVEHQGVINICSGIPRQIRHVVAEIGRLLGVGAGVLPDAKAVAPSDSRWIVGDESRLRATGWRPEASFSQRLASYVGRHLTSPK
jgi:nucleoside-diphosphate-sugar epimerase